LYRKLDFDDVLIVPRSSTVTSRADVVLEKTFTIGPDETTLRCVPIIAANMQNIGTVSVASILHKYEMLTALVKNTLNTLPTTFPAFNTYGMEGEVEDLQFICLDVANGYLSSFVERVKQVREKYPFSVIMAGNVVTTEGVENLAKAGADIIKVGLGSGSACTTRIKTGVGYPQLSAVLECSAATRHHGVYLCSDGGHRNPGDIAKSFAAGADFVMLGGMLSGTDETGAVFYGNASRMAQGTLEKYRAEEGQVIETPYKGSLDDVVQDILGGLRSACTYVGARNLDEFKQFSRIIQVK